VTRRAASPAVAGTAARAASRPGAPRLAAAPSQVTYGWAELDAIEHAQSFTVSRLARLDLLEQVPAYFGLSVARLRAAEAEQETT
jgi:uncharacterized protein with gpF-like domain